MEQASYVVPPASTGTAARADDFNLRDDACLQTIASRSGGCPKRLLLFRLAIALAVSLVLSSGR